VKIKAMDNTEMKVCPICNRNLALTRFYPTADICKQCEKREQTTDSSASSSENENKTTKTCRDCGKVDVIDLFVKGRNQCTECNMEYQKIVREKKKTEQQKTKKICDECKHELPGTDFRTGRRTCKECEKKGYDSPQEVRTKFAGKTKKCESCNSDLPASSFEVTGNGLRNHCTVCRRRANEEARRQRPDPPEKKCSKCGRILPISDFSPGRPECRRCRAEQAKK
jgi:hypothetical protein